MSVCMYVCVCVCERERERERERGEREREKESVCHLTIRREEDVFCGGHSLGCFWELQATQTQKIMALNYSDSCIFKVSLSKQESELL